LVGKFEGKNSSVEQFCSRVIFRWVIPIVFIVIQIRNKVFTSHWTLLSHRITMRSRCILSLYDSSLWITVCSFPIFYSIVTWWWPNDRGWNMLSPYHLKWNKINICNASCVLTCEIFIPYLYCSRVNAWHYFKSVMQYCIVK